MIVCPCSSASNDKTIMMAIGNISTTDAAKHGNASVTLPLIEIHHPSRRLIAYTLKATREILSIQLKHSAN